MISRINRWMRIHGPPWWTVTIFVVVYLCVEALDWWYWILFLRYLGADQETPDAVIGLRTMFPAMAAIAFGAYRVVCFHPIFRTAYRQWIERSPWTPAKSLPFGSPRLGVGDLILVACLCGLSARGLAIGPLVSLIGFLAAYCLATCVTAALCGLRVSFYLLAFGLVLVLRLGTQPPIALAASVLLLPLAIDALRRSLDPAGWLAKDRHTSQFQRFFSLGKKEELRLGQLGWPHGEMSPAVPPRFLAWPEKCLVPLLVGGFAYAAITTASSYDDEAGPLALFCVFGSGFLLIARLVMYVARYRSPINVWGRLFTWRWIVPGYDRVFLAPLTMLIVLVGFEILFLRLSTPLVISQPVVLAACLWICLNVGPPLGEWQLTGKLRVSTLGFSINVNLYDRA